MGSPSIHRHAATQNAVKRLQTTLTSSAYHRLDPFGCRPTRFDVASLRSVVALAFVLGGCDAQSDAQSDAPSPDPASTPAPPLAPPQRRFRFEPTLDAHKPKGATMELVAEAGDVATGTMTLVVAYHDGTDLSLAAWPFASTGEDDTLVPSAEPAPLLALTAAQSTDGETLDVFVRTRAAGHGAAARPQGVDAADPVAALEALHSDATLALDAAEPAATRVRGLAAFTRGLDDDLLFSRQGLAEALALLATEGPASILEASARRAEAKWGETKVSMLRKGDGWTVDALR